MHEFEETQTISAQAERIWDVLSDIGSIHVWNPGVKHSEQTTQGLVESGATRHCDLGGKNFLDEEVVTYQKPHKITFRITNTNLPFQTADIRFTLEPLGEETLVRVSPVYQLKYGVVGSILNAVVVKGQYQKGMRALLRGLKAYVEQSKGQP